jgi:hypothetical protein
VLTAAPLAAAVEMLMVLQCYQQCNRFEGSGPMIFKLGGAARTSMLCCLSAPLLCCMLMCALLCLLCLPCLLCLQEKKRINKEGELVITSQRTRSQA